MAEVLKIQEVKLDLKRVTAQPKSIQPLKIGDNGNVFVVELTDDGVPVDLTGTRVLAVFSRGDGKTAQQDVKNGVSVEGNIITIRLRTGSFTDGQNNCEIQVYSGENDETLVTSARFSFDGARGIVNDDTVEAEDAFPVLVELIATANAAIKEATEARERSETVADEIIEKTEEAMGDALSKMEDATQEVLDKADEVFHSLWVGTQQEFETLTIESGKLYFILQEGSP